MKRILFFAIFLLCATSLLQAQTRPFPQNVSYPNGYQTSIISTNHLQNAYNQWKRSFLKTYQGMYRVCDDDTTITISEGMGYGMLLTAYFGEQEIFDGLLQFYQSKRTDNAYNLMAWRVTRDGIIDPGSATDGDLDVAFALIVAHCQWGGNYLNEAKTILSILKEHYFVNCRGIWIMKPGGHFGGCNLTDLSYYTPGYFRVFADVTGDSFWETVVTDTYILLDKTADDATGLVPDWLNSDGAAQCGPSGCNDYYRYDACRTPWRMSLDFLWNGNTTAQAWCTKITNFANGIGAASIVDGYNLDGTTRGQYNNSAFVGGFAVGAMCNSQAIVNNFSQRLVTLNNGGWDNQYFNLSLRCLYMLALTGNFWKPDISHAYLEQPHPDNTAVLFAKDIISNGNIHGRLVIAPDGNELLWNSVNFSTTTINIYHVVYADGAWSSPEICSFAQNGLTANPVFSLDGTKLSFEFRADVNSKWTVKYIEKIDGGWSEPKDDESGVNGSASFTNTGKVYYSDYLANTSWERGIYCADYDSNGLSNIHALAAVINSQYIDYTPYISPDEDFLLFSSSRPSLNENMYLYISFKNADETWSEPEKINDTIGFAGNARFPSISPDGNYLFFCGDDGNIYWVDIKALDRLYLTHMKQSEIQPDGFQLFQNYPNPFNPSTTIAYSLSQQSLIQITIYNLNGQLIKTLINQQQAPGYYTVVWNATDEKNNPVSSGMYIYKIEADGFTLQKKMSLVR
ncbi:T9SS type A sorting domain-containing protein [candidate division KSB1 bacterium]|nr:T9SS type A sorting domain-containing protein [candidate division KSB1 bacterium]